MSGMWGTFNVREDHLKGLNKGDEFTAYVPAFNKDIKIKGLGYFLLIALMVGQLVCSP